MEAVAKPQTEAAEATALGAERHLSLFMRGVVAQMLTEL